MPFANMEHVLSEEELEQPFSFHEDGTMATLGEFIDQNAPTEARDAIGRDGQTPPASRVKSINELSEAELRQLAIEAVSEDDGTQLVSGRRTFSPQELKDEIVRWTAFGEKFTESLRCHAMLLEKAVHDGRIKLRDPNESLERPKLPW